ncbi:putative alcohol dehydrogenase protein [Podospora australis]|uniref:Alcohol dehydrogenase protein n=1 Tax=Podospora australis TaxID=1536484 RepID=A0AAN7ADH0_9PEZI|nr:putative alcohol dehydrogenase protein [Podospora australis]
MTTPMPETHKVYRRSPGLGTPSHPLNLIQSIEPVIRTPSGVLNPNQVLVKIKYVALNARDYLMLYGQLPIPIKDSGIAAGDCSGEVVALGSSVTRFVIGDCVSPTADAGNITGTLEPSGHIAIGEEADGVLGERGVHVRPFTLSLAGGIEPIITSSSDTRLASLRKSLDAPELKGFNYRTVSDQAAQVKTLTGGKRVDTIVNNSGPTTFPQDIDSLVAQYGTISVVGFLGGVTVEWNPGVLLGLTMKQAKLQGIGVGSRVDFENLLKFIEEKKIDVSVLLDEKVFGFEESPAAFDYLAAGQHTGKVHIRVASD